jgi:hypothetical protein
MPLPPLPSADSIDLAQLRAWCAEWQKRLRLQDWRIEVKWFALTDPGESLGNCRWNEARKMATIQVRKPEVISDEPAFNKDLEATLVHELLHLQFYAVQPRDHGTLNDVFEAAIDLTAEALVAAKRGE